VSDLCDCGECEQCRARLCDRLLAAIAPTQENIAEYYDVPASANGSTEEDIVAILAAIAARAGVKL
jgi:hypothetical protein